jgi:hypothetical protein
VTGERQAFLAWMREHNPPYSAPEFVERLDLLRRSIATESGEVLARRIADLYLHRVAMLPLLFRAGIAHAPPERVERLWSLLLRHAIDAQAELAEACGHSELHQLVCEGDRVLLDAIEGEARAHLGSREGTTDVETPGTKGKPRGSEACEDASPAQQQARAHTEWMEMISAVIGDLPEPARRPAADWLRAEKKARAWTEG